MLIEEMTMKEFKAGLKKTRTLIVPYGTVEAHGAHLPLSTDTLIITGALKRVSALVPVFVAPPIHYGVCTSTGLHPGTIGITPETLRRMTLDIVRDGHKKGLRNFILVSGHGGGSHVGAMKEAAEVLVCELKGVRIAALSIYDMIGKEIAALAETENDSHAGEMETSAVKHLAPGFVKGTSRKEYPVLPKPFVVKDKLRYWPGAVWGDPSKASAAKGEKLIDVMAEKIIGLVAGIEK